MNDTELPDLIKKNIALNEEVLRTLRRDILYRRIFGVIKYAILTGIFAWFLIKALPFLAPWFEFLQRIPRIGAG